MRPYEVMVIFDADLDEETIRSAVTRSTQLIESKGAQPGLIDFWGKRRFAYELKHRWEGYYVVFQAKAEPAAMDELHRVLALADEVLRHKILRIPEQVYGKIGAQPGGGRPAPEPVPATAPEPTAAPEAVSEPEPVPGPEPEPEPEREGEGEGEPEAEAQALDDAEPTVTDA